MNKVHAFITIITYNQICNITNLTEAKKTLLLNPLYTRHEDLCKSIQGSKIEKLKIKSKTKVTQKL